MRPGSAAVRLGRRPPPAAPRFAPPVRRHRLAAGPEVWWLADPTMPLVSLLWAAPAGADYDPPGSEGLAALAVSLLRSGTARRSAQILAAQLEALGADLFTGCGWESASVGVECLSEDLDAALSTLGEVVQAPSFPAAAVARRRRWRLAELAQQRLQPAAVADRRLARALYGTARQALPRAGGEEAVGRLSARDLRAFHRAGWGPRHARLFAVGGFRPEALLRRLEGIVTPDAAAVPPIRRPAAPAGPAPGGCRVVLVDAPAAPRTELRIGTLGPGRCDADFAPLEVLDAILGGVSSGRLRGNLRRRRGLVYGVHSRLSERRGPSPWVVAAATGHREAGAAVREILREIERLGREPVAPEELRTVAECLATRDPSAFQNHHSAARRLLGWAEHGLTPDDVAGELERIAGLDPRQLLGVAQRRLDPRRLVVVAVGPAGELRRELASFGEVIESDVDPPPRPHRIDQSFSVKGWPR